MNSLFDAIRLLTIFPAPSNGQPPRAAMLYWFPVVGAVIGGVLLAANVILMMVIPTPAMLLISPIVLGALWLVITRGLHLDGLGDTFDALGAIGDRDRRLHILRDPHIGSFGVGAIVLVLVTKIMALASLDPVSRMPALIGSTVCARWVIVPACALFPYARKEGLGAALIGQAGWAHVIVTTLMVAAILHVLKIPAVPLILAAVVTGMATAIISNRSFGGITGDVLGAMIEIVECAGLLVFVYQS